MGIIASLSYIIGNIQPDLCFTSYLLGVEPGDEKRGHSYSTAMKRIRVLENLKVSNRIFAAYVLGKISHYAADSFTFPHNQTLFSGTLKEHMKYERLLDDVLRNAFNMHNEIQENDISDVFSFLSKLHEKYERQKPSPHNDVSYIIPIALILATSFNYVTNQRLKRTIAVL